MGRYLAGIDLGTTNSAIAYIDTSTKSKFPEIKLHHVHQLNGPADFQPHALLPSFLYLPGGNDLPEGSAALPWDKSRSFIVGNFARSQGAKVPGRLVSSAKSWLCHPGVDRKAPLLPWAAPPEVSRLSPLDVSAKYLKHIVESWNHSVSLGQLAEPLENQTVVVTVPASFDDIARSLTMEAAKLAGLKNVLLLEEPQAAFYRWLSLHQQNKTKEIELSEGMQCLVIDVGGGTTDFTLIETISENGTINFLRKAVGDHLLLGGDNMDLALAKLMESRFPAGTKLDASQYIQLTQVCRNAKEQILSDTPPETIPINIMGRGRSIVAGLIRAELSAKEASAFILDGFFPLVNRD
ncbi:MAG: Hsp70 family protein, partial [Gemmataceae bacterium]|nr:Hsp70 family protein [Gemmataceae bacterium]